MELNEKEKYKQEIVSFENVDFKKDCQVYIDDVSFQYCQNGDCTETEGDVQEITISTRNNGCARFINIKTGENGWSIDSVDALKELIEDFEKRAALK